ncbi:Seipin, partial [Eufriesea mexicana]
MLISRLLEEIHKKLFHVQKRTKRSVQSARNVLLSGGIIIISEIFIIWLSVFLYTAFYYAYVPSVSYVRPVHLQFVTCNEPKGMCSFPAAKVQLTNKQQLLMVGQPYKVNLHLEMPESPVNKQLGMFMVCAELRNRNDIILGQACRSTMLHYRSSLLQALTTLTFSPMMIFGTTEEKQNVVLELFGNFEEDQNHPVTSIYVEVKSKHIELYSASIMINAHLSGLRYLMFHWPILSGIIGIGTNLFFITLVSYFTIYEDSGDDGFSYEEGKKIEKIQEYEGELNTKEEEEHKTEHKNDHSSLSEDTIVLPYLLTSKEESDSSEIELV